MQSTIPNVDSELIRRRFDQVTADLNLCTTRASGNRGPDLRELSKCIQGFSQLMAQITSDYGTHPQYVVGQHVCCNTIVMVLEFGVKPALAHYCSTTASKSLMSAQQTLQTSALTATRGRCVRTAQGDAWLLPNAEGPRQSKKAQQLRQDVVRPFVELVLTLHRSLPLEPLTGSQDALNHQRTTSASSSGAAATAGTMTGTGVESGARGFDGPGSDFDGAAVFGASGGGAAASIAGGLARSTGDSADAAGQSGSNTGGGGTGLMSAFSMAAIVTPAFTTDTLPSTAPLLWKHAEPLRLVTQHALDVLESEVLSVVVGQEYAGLLTSLLALDGYARTLPTVFVRTLTDRLLTLLERIEPEGDGAGSDNNNNMSPDLSDSTYRNVAAPVLPPSTSGTTAATPLYAVSSDEGVVFTRLLLTVFTLPQMTTSFRAVYQLNAGDHHHDGDGRAGTTATTAAANPIAHDTESMEVVMRRLCRVLRAWHRRVSGTLRLEAVGLQTLSQLVRIIAHDYPSVASEPLDLLKPLCDACFAQETLRKDHWRLEVFECVTVQICHQFASLLGRQVPEDIHASFLRDGRYGSAMQDDDNSEDEDEEENNVSTAARGATASAVSPEDRRRTAALSRVRGVAPRALLFLHETALPMVLQLFSQRQHEYSFMSRRDLFYFPCAAVQEVLDLGAVVVYTASCTYDAYRAERETIDSSAAPADAGNRRSSPHSPPSQQQQHHQPPMASSLPALLSLRRQLHGQQWLDPPERLLRSLRLAFGGEPNWQTSEQRNASGTTQCQNGPAGEVEDEEGENAGGRGMDGASFRRQRQPNYSHSTSAALPSLTAVPGWLLQTTASTSTRHITTLSDAALFHLHLFAQPCTTLNWPTDACDALVQGHLCPLFALFSGRLARLLTAALDATVPRCSPRLQQRVMQWAVEQAMPRPSSSISTSGGSGMYASAGSSSATLATSSLSGGGGHEGRLAPEAYWYRLLSTMMDRAVLGGWPMLLPRLPLRALFLRAAAASLETTATKTTSARTLADVTCVITDALGTTHRAVNPWCRAVRETRLAFEQGEHYAFISTQVEATLRMRERGLDAQWSRYSGKETTTMMMMHGTATSARGASSLPASDNVDRESAAGEWRSRAPPAHTTNINNSNASGLLSNVVSSTPAAVMNDALNAMSALSSLLTPALFLFMVRLLSAAEMNAATEDVLFSHDGLADSTSGLLDPSRQKRDERTLTNALQAATTAMMTNTTGHEPQHRGAPKSEATREEKSRTVHASAAAMTTLARIHETVSQQLAAQDNLLLSIRLDGDATPPLEQSLLFVHDALAHACCVLRPQRDGGVAQQLLKYQERRGDAVATGAAAVTSASAVLANASSSLRSGVAALLSVDTVGNSIASIASSSPSCASGRAQAQAWRVWSQMLDEAENYAVMVMTHAARRLAGSTGASSSSSTASSSSPLSVMQVGAAAQRRYYQCLLQRYRRPQHRVPAVVACAAEGQWLLRYPTTTSSNADAVTGAGNAATSNANVRSEAGVDDAHTSTTTTTTAATSATSAEPFSVLVPRLWLTTSSPALAILSRTIVTTFDRFVRRVTLAEREVQLFTLCKPSRRAMGPRDLPRRREGLNGDPTAATATATMEAGGDVEASAQIHLTLCVQAAQLVQWLLRLYRQGVWAPPGAEREDGTLGNVRTTATAATSATGGATSSTSEAHDLHVLRTTSVASWYAQPEATLSRLTPSGRIFFVVLWVVRFLHVQLANTASAAVPTTATTTTATAATQAAQGLPDLSLVSSRTALLALLHLYTDVGEVMLHARFACADPSQVILCFSGALSRRLLDDGVRQLVLRWRPTDTLAQELAVPIMETAQIALRLLTVILWTVQRTRVLQSSVDPFVAPESVSHVLLDVLAHDSLFVRPDQPAPASLNVNERKPFIPFCLPLLEPLLQTLLLLRFDFDNRGARDAYWQVIQTVYARYAASATPALLRVVGSTPALFLSAALAPASVRAGGFNANTTSANASSVRLSSVVSRFSDRHHMNRDGALLLWLTQLVEGRDPSTASQPMRSAMAPLPAISPTPVPSAAPLTPPLECAMLSATFQLLPLCPENLSEQLGRHTFGSLSADAAYTVRRHTAHQVQVLFRLFHERGDRVLQDLIHVCRGGILSLNPLLCATSLLALAEAAKAAPWLETNVVYTLLECWATRGFCFRGQVLECLQSIGEGGTVRAGPFNTVAASGGAGSGGGGGGDVSGAMGYLVSRGAATGDLGGDGQTWLARLVARQRSQEVDDNSNNKDSADDGVAETDPVLLEHPRKRGRDDDTDPRTRRGQQRPLRPRRRRPHSTPLRESPLLPAFAAICQSYGRTLLFRWLWDFHHAFDAFPFLCFGCVRLEQLAWQQMPSLLTVSLMLSAAGLGNNTNTNTSGGGTAMTESGVLFGGPGAPVMDVLVRAVKMTWWNGNTPRHATRTERQDGKAALASASTSDIALRLIVLCFAPLVAQLVVLASREQPAGNLAGSTEQVGDALLGMGDGAGHGERGRRAAGVFPLHKHDDASAAISAAAESALYWLQTVLNEAFEDDARFESVVRDVRPELYQPATTLFPPSSPGNRRVSPFLKLLALESDRVVCCVTDLYSEEDTPPLASLTVLERGLERVADWLWTALPERAETTGNNTNNKKTRASAKTGAHTRRSGATLTTDSNNNNDGEDDDDAAATAAAVAAGRLDAESTEDKLLWQVLAESQHGGDQSSGDAMRPSGLFTDSHAHPRLFLFQRWLRRCGGDAACGLASYVLTHALTPPSSAQALASAIWLPRTFFGTARATNVSAEASCEATRAPRWSPRTFFRSATLEDRLVLLRHLVRHWLPPRLLCSPPVMQTALMIVLRLLQPLSTVTSAAQYSWSEDATEYVRTLACDMLLHIWPVVVQVTAPPSTATATTTATASKTRTHRKRTTRDDGNTVEGRNGDGENAPTTGYASALLPSSRARLLLLGTLDSTLATTMMAMANESAVVASTWTVLCRIDPLLRSWDWQRLAVGYAATTDARMANTRMTSNKASSSSSLSSSSVSSDASTTASDVDDDDVVIVDFDNAKPANSAASTANGRDTSTLLSHRTRASVSILLSLVQRLPFVVDGGGAPAANYLIQLADALDAHRDALTAALRHSSQLMAAPAATTRLTTSAGRRSAKKRLAYDAWTCHVRVILTQSLSFLLRVSVQSSSSPTRASTAEDGDVGGVFTARTIVNWDAARGSSSLDVFNVLRSLSWCFLEVGEGWTLERELIQKSSQSTGWTVLRHLTSSLLSGSGRAAEAIGSSLMPSSSLLISATGAASQPSLTLSSPPPLPPQSRAAPLSSSVLAVSPPRSPIDVLHRYRDEKRSLGAALDEIAGLHYAQLLDSLERLTHAPGALTAALATQALRACLALEERAVMAPLEAAVDDATRSPCFQTQQPNTLDARTGEKHDDDEVDDGVCSVRWRTQAGRQCASVDGLLLLLARHTVFRYSVLASVGPGGDEIAANGKEEAAEQQQQTDDVRNKPTTSAAVSTTIPTTTTPQAVLPEVIERWKYYRFRRHTTFDEALLRNLLSSPFAFDAIVGTTRVSAGSTSGGTGGGGGRSRAPTTLLASTTLVSCSPLPAPGRVTAATTTSTRSTAASTSCPPPLHVLEETLWQELTVFHCESTFVPLFVLALIETYRLDDKVRILAEMKPLLRAEACAAAVASVVRLETAGDDIATSMSANHHFYADATHDSHATAAETTTTTTTSAMTATSARREQLRARRRQVSLSSAGSPAPFWLCLLSLGGGDSRAVDGDDDEDENGVAAQAADADIERPFRVDVDVAGRGVLAGLLATSAASGPVASAAHNAGPNLSETLLPLVFLHLMLQSESGAVRALRCDWSVRLDVHVIARPQRYPRLVRLLLHTLYEGCYAPLTVSLSTTGLRGFKPAKDGTTAATSSATTTTNESAQSCLLGALPVLSTVRECFWLADIPALHLAHAATVACEPYLAVLFAELSGECLLTIDAVPPGEAETTNAAGELTSLSAALFASDPASPSSSSAAAAAGAGAASAAAEAGAAANGGLPVTLAVLSGVDGRGGDVLWLRDAPSVSHGASALFPSRPARNASATSTATTMQTSSRSRRARLEAREAVLQARFAHVRSLWLPIFASAHTLLPSQLEGRGALAEKQAWRAQAAQGGSRAFTSTAASQTAMPASDPYATARFWTLADVDEGAEAAHANGDQSSVVQQRMERSVATAHARITAHQNLLASALARTGGAHHAGNDDDDDDDDDNDGCRGSDAFGSAHALQYLDTASHQLSVLSAARATPAMTLMTTSAQPVSQRDHQARQAALKASVLVSKGAALLRAGLYHTAQEVLSGALACLDPATGSTASPPLSSSPFSNFGSHNGGRGRGRDVLDESRAKLSAYLAEASWRCGAWHTAGASTASTVLAFALRDEYSDYHHHNVTGMGEENSNHHRSSKTRQNALANADEEADGTHGVRGGTKGDEDLRTHGKQASPLRKRFWHSDENHPESVRRFTSLVQTARGVLKVISDEDDLDGDATDGVPSATPAPLPGLVLRQLGIAEGVTTTTTATTTPLPTSSSTRRSYHAAVLSALLATASSCAELSDTDGALLMAQPLTERPRRSPHAQHVRTFSTTSGTSRIASAVRDGFAALQSQLQPTTWLASMVAAEALKDIQDFAQRHAASTPPRWLQPMLSVSDVCSSAAPSSATTTTTSTASTMTSARSGLRAPLPLEAGVLDSVRLALCQLSGHPRWWRAWLRDRGQRVLSHTDTPQLTHHWLQELDLSLRLQQEHVRRCAWRLTASFPLVDGEHDTNNTNTGTRGQANTNEEEEEGDAARSASSLTASFRSNWLSGRHHTSSASSSTAALRGAEEGLELVCDGLARYVQALSFTAAERTELTLTQAQSLYALGARREAIALLQNVAADGERLPFSCAVDTTATPTTTTTGRSALRDLVRLTSSSSSSASSLSDGQCPSLFQLPASATSDPRVVHLLMTWLHADAVVPLSLLVRDAHFTRCAVQDTSGSCSFLLARLCHILSRDIAARVRTYDFKKMQASLEDSRQQHRALVAQSERLNELAQLTDAEKRVLHQRIKNLQGDIEQEEREVLTEVRNYHLYRRSALNSYARYLQVTSECGDRDVHAVFGLAELWFQSEERASGSTLLLEEDDDQDDDDDDTTANTRAFDKKSDSGRRSDASATGPGGRKTDKAKNSAHVTTEVLQRALTQIPSFRFIPLFSQLTSRLGSGERVTTTTTTITTTTTTTSTATNESVASFVMGRRNTIRLYRLVERVTRDHPLYTMWSLLALAHGQEFGTTGSTLHQADRDKVDAAKRILSDVQRGRPYHPTASKATAGAISSAAQNEEAAAEAEARRTSRYIQDARTLSAAYHELGAYKSADTSSRPHRIAPDFQLLEKIHSLSIPPPTMTLPTHTSATRTDTELCALIPRVHHFRDRFTTPGGINVPKVLVCVLSDGQSVRQLLKSNDDLRQDALIEQAFQLANGLFLRSRGLRASQPDHVVAVGAPDTRATESLAPSLPPLSVRTYNVVPLSPSTGVLEWVDDTVPFGEYIAGLFGTPYCTPGAHERYFPHEMSNWACRERLKRAGRRDLGARHQALLELYAHYSPALHYYFTENFLNVHDWLDAQQSYIRSVAASSLTGFAVGLGDRHGSNLLLHKRTGELVHIDLGIAFDQSRLLPVPEMVPFRLTRNVVDGFGVRGVDGGFRERCEEAMHVLRARRGLLLAVLEAFLYDPIAKWAVVATPAGAAAAPTAAEAEAKEGKPPRAETTAAGTTTATAAQGQRNNVRTTTTNSGDAQRTLARVEAKLKGYDAGEQLLVPAHVQKLIQSAQSTANLSAMFEGWSPWL